MSSARSAILARVAAARRATRLPPPPDAQPLVLQSRTSSECLARLREELAAPGVDCHVAATAEEVRERVRALVDGKRILSWDADCLPYGVGSLLPGAASGSSPRDEQARAEVGVTGCDGAIAETGTLALLSGTGCSRAVSLLPPMHVAVVQSSQICFSMAEFFLRERERLDVAACCTFVTGPSRTADIELTLTLGVHGPGRVVVVVGP